MNGLICWMSRTSLSRLHFLCILLIGNNMVSLSIRINVFFFKIPKIISALTLWAQSLKYRLFEKQTLFQNKTPSHVITYSKRFARQYIQTSLNEHQSQEIQSVQKVKTLYSKWRSQWKRKCNQVCENPVKIVVRNQLLEYIEDITRWCEDIKFIFEWKKQRTSEIVFPREDKLHIFKPTCNFLFIT